MAGNKVVKSVSLNLNVDDDQLILKHVKKKNFSGYVKKLILEEIKQQESAKREEPAAKPLSVKEELEQLKKRESSSAPTGVFINIGNNKKQF